jgi:hypothetical protein
MVFAAILAGCEESETAMDLIAALVGVVRGTPPPASEEEGDEVHPDLEKRIACATPPEQGEQLDAIDAQPVKRPVSKRAPTVQGSHAKALTEDTVTELRERYWGDGDVQKDLADEFDVSPTTVAKVIRRQVPYAEGILVRGEPEPGEAETDEDRERRHQARRDRAADAVDPGFQADGGFTVRAS